MLACRQLFQCLAVLSSVVVHAAAHVPTTRYFNMSLTWDTLAPDGFERKGALINGQFPGPTLELHEGDQVVVFVQNLMPYNTSMHFHGIEMLGTPWADGVPGLTQRSIMPHETFTYKWKATQHGSYWYHSHVTGQIDDGLYGALVIHPKDYEASPLGLISKDDDRIRKQLEAAVREAQPLLIGDWQHRTSPERWQLNVDTGIEVVCYDSILVNGKGSVGCMDQGKIDGLTDKVQKMRLQEGGAERLTPKGCLPPIVLSEVLAKGYPTNISALPAPVFDVCTPTEGATEVVQIPYEGSSEPKWVALDLIGVMGLLTVNVAMDGLPMWVYAVDGSYIEPQLVNVITVSNGERYSVLVQLSKPGDYTIRIASILPAQIIAGTATLRYGAAPKRKSRCAPTSYIDDRGANTTAGVTFFSHTNMKMYPPRSVSEVADQTVKMYMRTTGFSYQWSLSYDAYTHQHEASPLLFEENAALIAQVAENSNTTIVTKNNTWVDIVFITGLYPLPPHPIHKHGNKMYLIGQGTGHFTWNSVAEAMQDIPQNFNLVDPPMRDGIRTLQANSEPTWVVVRYHSNDPGPWLLHCHINTHSQGGMNAVLLDGIDEWNQEIPKEYLPS